MVRVTKSRRLRRAVKYRCSTSVTKAILYEARSPIESDSGTDDDEIAVRVTETAALRLVVGTAHSEGLEVSLREAGGHSCVTHSRNPADTGGNRRTRRRSTSSTGGTARTPEGTRGHDMTPVRDREAPGSNPGPPTILYSKLAISGVVRSRRVTAGSQ